MNDGLFSGVGAGRPGSVGRFAWQEVTTSQNLTGPAWARFVSIWACGGGGGGGAGRMGISTNASGGGGGGGGGSRYVYRIPIKVFSKRNLGKWSVTIGAGGGGASGSNSDGAVVNQGSNAGTTTVTYNHYAPLGSSFIMQGTGGGGGAGGSTTTVSGGFSGGSNNGTSGQGGGQGVTGNQIYPSNTSVSEPTNPVMGGIGGAGKGFQGLLFYVSPCYAFGSLSATSTGTEALGYNGVHAICSIEPITKQFLNGLQRAPTRDELWWVTFYGGGGGLGGSTSSVINGGNGGNGYRGSGGGGGGGAGFAGAFSGAGGNGGNGSAIFFWEEY